MCILLPQYYSNVKSLLRVCTTNLGGSWYWYYLQHYQIYINTVEIITYYNALRKELTKMQKGGDGHYKDSLLDRMPFTIMQCSILTVKTDRYYVRGEKTLLVAP